MGAPATEEQVKVFAPDGSKVTVPASELQTALQSGYTQASAEEVAAEAERQHYTETPEQIKTGAEGLLRGASLGLSDLAATETGLVDAEDMRKRKEHNAGLALGTELVGGVAPLLIPGGGVAAGVARGAGFMPRAVAGLGAAVERGAAKVVGQGILGRAASLGASGAVEGALVGGGMAVSDAVLQDHELTGEMVVAGMGHGALMGGAAGGALGAGIGTLAKGASLVVDGTQAAVKGAKALLPDGAAAGAARQADELLPAGALDDLAPAGAPVDEGFTATFTRGQKAVRELDDVQEATTAQISKRGTRKEEVSDEILSGLTMEQKYKAAAKAMDADDAAGVIAKSADDTLEEAQAMVTSLRKELDDVERYSGRFERRDVGAAAALKKRLVEVDQSLRKMKTSKKVSREQVFREIDQFKRVVGKAQERAGGREVVEAGMKPSTVGGIMRTKYDEMAAHLVDEGAYGRGAAEVQMPDNLAWTSYFDARGGYRKNFLLRGDDAAGKRTADGFNRSSVFDPGKAGPLARSAGREQSALKEKLFRESVASENALVRQLAESHGASPKIKALVAEHDALSRDMVADLDKAMVTAADARKQQALLDDMRGIPMLEAGARAAVTLVEGAAKLTGLRTQAAGVSSKLDKAVKAAVSGTKKAAAKAGAKSKAVIKQAAGKSRRERFDGAAQRVKAANANPVATGEQIAARMGDHPVTSAVVGTVVRGNAFLKSKMPAPLIRDSDRQPHLDETQRVASSEMAKWLRYVEAVENPMSVVKALESGDMTREAAEALRVVHPKMYASLKDRVTDKIATSKERIPRSKLVQLSILFDEPYHYSMEPGFMASMQRAGADDAAAEDRSQSFIAPSARKAPDTASQMMTTTQRLSQ